MMCIKQLRSQAPRPHVVHAIIAGSLLILPAGCVSSGRFT
jgi:hypothetical protein